MSQAKDLTGQRFGQLVAVERQGSDARRNALWLCRCDCGGKVVARAAHLKSGNTASCGCLQRTVAAASVAELSIPVDDGRVCLECHTPLGARVDRAEFCGPVCRQGYHEWHSMAAAFADPRQKDPDVYALPIQPLYGMLPLPREPETRAEWGKSARADMKATAEPEIKLAGLSNGWEPGRYAEELADLERRRAAFVPRRERLRRIVDEHLGTATMPT